MPPQPPPIPLKQNGSWPGVISIAEIHYTAGWGLTPGLATIVTYPQFGSIIAPDGTLVIQDSNNTITLPGCQVLRITGEMGSDGTTYTIEIQDRRWSWQGLGSVSIDANAMDMRKKLVPWSIYSPQELAEQCLEVMGEVNYDVSALPDGLDHSVGQNLDRYLQAGENFAQSLANPHTTWDHTPPFEALARVCDLYGCVVTLKHSTNSVVICKQGVGNPLPDGPCESIAQGVTNPRVPASLNVAGAPVRIQARFAIEPVGEEWDGRIVPINDLSYAPIVPSAVQISTATYTGTGVPTFLGVYITFAPGTQQEDTLTFASAGAPNSIITQLQEIAGKINGSAAGFLVAATVVGQVLTITGKFPNVQFGVETQQVVPLPNTWVANLAQPASPPNGRSWCYAVPPDFSQVQATPQLSYVEAIQKAQKSVWRMFRILNVNVSTGKPPMFIPWYKGEIVRRQQIVLQNSRVEQVVPSPRIQGGNNANPIAANLPGEFGILADYYDGYSQDRPAICRGSVAREVMAGQVNWTGTTWNTAANQRIYVDFDVNPYEQLITFNDYVYKYANPGAAGFLVPPTIVLETACLVKDPDFGNLIRWEVSLPIGGNAPPQWEIHEDVAVGVIGQYQDSQGGGQQNNYVGFTFGTGDVQDANNRAAYYLSGMKAKIQVPQSDNRRYIGIVPIDLSGTVQQVSYSVGSAGPTTVAGLNTEFSISIPTYSNRRRAENSPPDASAADANARERAAAMIPAIDPNFGIKT